MGLEHNIRVLLVDDETDIRETLTDYLEDHDYHVTQAASGSEALTCFENERPDLILVDLIMPGIDGFAVIRTVVEQTPEIPILVISGAKRIQDVIQAMRLGAWEFILKPIEDMAFVIQLIEKALNHARIVEENRQYRTRLEAQNQLLKNAFDAVLAGVILLDAHFHIQMVSAKACQILGIEEAQALTKPAALILGAPIAGPMGMLAQCAKQMTGIQETSAQLLCPNGQIIPVALTINLVDSNLASSSWLLAIRDLREEERLLRQASKSYVFGSMISCSSKMRTIFGLIEKVAETQVTVLIEGESGTGKELTAREIHERSLRAQGPFHAVNCAAISPQLLESEFFGHERGAFTGAQQTKAGRFELANEGTLFLDEVGELPLELQGKLLRVLQEQQFERVGGTRTLRVNVRVIAATNRNLEEMVQQHRFRQDLYYRLSVVPIVLLPLRERVEDIPLLVNAFIDQLNRRENRQLQDVTPDALQALVEYPWPGNIRELFNVIEYVFALGSGDVLDVHHLPEKVQSLLTPDSTLPSPQNEKEYILQALQKANFQKQKAASLLGIHRNTLSRKMRKYGL